MNCSLCDQPIKDYNSSFHHLQINETRAVDICPECLDKLFKWQGKIFSNLFPTTAMKKRFGEKK